MTRLLCLSRKTISMNRMLSLFTLISLSLTALVGCQQPYRCGARDEPCCNFEGIEPCIADLNLRCNAGVCQGAVRTACPAPGGRCDVGLQNCAAGQSCQVVGSATQCVASGTGIDGAPCTTEEQCAPGHFCASAGNVCRRYCCGATGCAANQTCIPGLAGSAVGFCLVTNCDPVGQTGCPNAGCYVVALEDGRITNACLGAGTLPRGASCDGSVNCVPGSDCFGSVCRQICRPSSPSCDSGVCTPTEGADDVGACI